jgi:carboxypeptidase family protein
VIEQLYKKINGSLDGLEQRIAGVAVTTASPETPTGQSAQPAIQPAAPAPSPETAPSPQTSPVLDPPPAETPKAETPKRDAPLSSPMSEEEAQRLASARTRTSVKISGKVVDADKVGIANATLVLISPTGMVLTATTDNDGNYSFMVAAPSQKTYRIIPSKDGYSFAPVDKTFAGLLDDQREIDFVATKQ